MYPPSAYPAATHKRRQPKEQSTVVLHTFPQSREGDQQVMVNLTPDIWLHIASFVDDYELHHLLSVNSVFFDTAMNLKWNKVVLMTRGTSEAMHILTRLSSGVPVPSC